MSIPAQLPTSNAAHGSILVEPVRSRQTARPATPFRDVLAGGVNILLSGAEVATSVVAGPVLAAAVHGARTDVAGLAGSPPEGAVPPLASEEPQLGSLQALQRESQAFNLRLLTLQQEVQQESQQFSTVSNVMRARHDTAKAAIANIRS
jgi:hypothetical protein